MHLASEYYQKLRYRALKNFYNEYPSNLLSKIHTHYNADCNMMIILKQIFLKYKMQQYSNPPNIFIVKINIKVS